MGLSGQKPRTKAHLEPLEIIMDQHLELFAALAAPFMTDEVRTRPQGARQIHYITARTVMNRLDDVLGPAGWWDEYVPMENSVICRLTIRLPDGTTLTKSDAGGYAGMADSGDDDKSGFSDAFKRAAVKFGIGRYLYRDGVPGFVQVRLRHPSLAAESAQPTQHVPPSLPHHEQTSSSIRSGGDAPTAPQSGKALFAWVKKQDEKHGFGLLKSISDWAQRQDFPARMVQGMPNRFRRRTTWPKRRSGRLLLPRIIPRRHRPRRTMDGMDLGIKTRRHRREIGAPTRLYKLGWDQLPNVSGKLRNLAPPRTGDNFSNRSMNGLRQTCLSKPYWRFANRLHRALGSSNSRLTTRPTTTSSTSAPFDHIKLPHYHWQIEFIPRLSKVVGFE
jgi:hypothetical protein